ncbi:unnamed protein product [Triticum turgidum subsp. durum]|uniref:Homeobox domain-containing protein n=1 Tax=Triticum turgidum subsp. durum TaxID=4567 RepID=A0A9R0VU51_TRITD|nr:unnamed protein product [Triticum turgidum subsp. durum]
MATFFSTSNDQRGLAGGGGGGGDMSFHHHYPMSNQYPDSSTGGLIPLPASIVQQSHIAHHGGGGDGRDDEPAAFMSSRDGSELGGLQTQMLMGDGGASAGQRSHQGGLSLSLGSQVPVSLYQYGRPGGMAAAAFPTLMSPNQSAMAMAASRNAQVNVYVQNSRFLKAARELLDEVVSVRDAIKRKGDRKDDSAGNGECGKVEGDKGEENEGSSAAELSPAERQDLQNKVTALMAMLDQVDRRYRHYHQQMQMVVSSFDAVDGSGAGGLSRLRYIDQHLRQQRAMQQFGMMQQPQHAWRPQRGLPESAVSVLRAWLFEHFLHPYPKDSEKVMLARQAGLSRGQVSNWFINARVRLWKPMVEEMYKEEFGAEMDSTNSSSENAGNKHGKVDEAACSEDQDRDEFQSTSTHAGASQLLNAYKSEPVGSMDAGPLSSLGGGDMGTTYAPAGPSLNHHGPGGGSLLQDAFAHHGGDDARFVTYGGSMGDLGGSVSLTLGLQHCNNNNNNAGHVPPEQQGLLYGNPGDFDFLNGGDDRQRFASSSSQLLHDFVT